MHGMYHRQSRARGRGQSFRYAGSPANARPPADPNIMDGLLSEPMLELPRPLSPSPTGVKDIQPRQVTPIASYNWTNDNEPTIIVPGCPPIWQNKPTPFGVTRDNTMSFIDQNKHRIPQHPLLPLMLAVDHLSPDFDFPSIDIVTDRNNLRKLLRWIDGTDRDFRIEVQLCGSTVLFTRFESRTVETEPGWLGYGRGFEQFTTKRLAGCEKSTGHHRIISYDFGGLTLLVRFEVDACLHHDQQTQAREDSPSDQRTIPGDDPNDITAALRKMSISKDERVNIVSSGILVPQSSLIELGTMSDRTFTAGINWQEYFPQLFVSQTPHHFLGVQTRGQFRRIEKRILNDSVLFTVREKLQPSFDKLCAILKTIRELAIAHGEAGRLSLVFRGATGKLQVFRRESKENALPESWLNRFRARDLRLRNVGNDEKAPASSSIGPGGSDAVPRDWESDDSDAENLAGSSDDESDQ